jgi:hypothetical protein
MRKRARQLIESSVGLDDYRDVPLKRITTPVRSDLQTSAEAGQAVRS